MSEHTMSISEVQDKITRLPEELAENPEAVTVTRHGKPVMAILSYKEYESLVNDRNALKETIDSLLETIEILQDEELMAAFREGVQELAEGKGRPLNEVLKELGWE